MQAPATLNLDVVKKKIDKMMKRSQGQSHARATRTAIA
jgi:hypothetical protein